VHTWGGPANLAYQLVGQLGYLPLWSHSRVASVAKATEALCNFLPKIGKPENYRSQGGWCRAWVHISRYCSCMYPPGTGSRGRSCGSQRTTRQGRACSLHAGGTQNKLYKRLHKSRDGNTEGKCTIGPGLGILLRARLSRAAVLCMIPAQTPQFSFHTALKNSLNLLARYDAQLPLHQDT